VRDLDGLTLLWLLPCVFTAAAAIRLLRGAAAATGPDRRSHVGSLQERDRFRAACLITATLLWVGALLADLPLGVVATICLALVTAALLLRTAPVTQVPSVAYEDALDEKGVVSRIAWTLVRAVGASVLWTLGVSAHGTPVQVFICSLAAVQSALVVLKAARIKTGH